MKNIILLLLVSPTTCDKHYRVEVSGASRNILPASIRDMSLAFGFTFPGHPRTWGTPQ